jgi:hypothetical protein
MVEIFFGIITRQAIRHGTFTSVKDLIAAIETFIDSWNERCQPCALHGEGLLTAKRPEQQPLIDHLCEVAPSTYTGRTLELHQPTGTPVWS